MKILINIALLCMLVVVGACSDADDAPDYGISSESVFQQSALSVPAQASEAVLVVECIDSDWELSIPTDNGVIDHISPSSGSNHSGVKEYIKVRLTLKANTDYNARSQELILMDKTNNRQTKLMITQNSTFAAIDLAVTPSVKYQPIVGFGGMYNPKTWVGSNLLTDADMNKLYGVSGLGYSILRLMIYPNEADWAADVAGAKIAEQNGAIIFACPWDCTDALDDKSMTGKKHLTPAKYQEYTNHLVRYINYMKAEGVNLYAISMQNEPDMDFTYWTPAEVVDYVKNYGAQIRAAGVKLMSPEACGMSPDYTDPVLNDAGAFANTDIVAGHLYQGFIDLSSSYSKARHDYITGLYNQRLAPVDKTWWMTEHLFNDGEKETDPSKWVFMTWDYSMSHLAREIHMTMDGYGSAYVYWYLKRFYGMLGDADAKSPAPEGEITKNGYILSHYAKYATGTTRIKIDSSDAGVLATAYTNSNETEITLVVLNTTTKDSKLTITLPVAAENVSAIQTTQSVNMEATTAQLSQDGKSATVLVSANGIVSVKLGL